MSVLFENRVADVSYRDHPFTPEGGAQLREGHALAPETVREHLAVLHQDGGRVLDQTLRISIKPSSPRFREPHCGSGYPRA